MGQINFTDNLSETKFVRQNWISACQFHILDEMEVLREVSIRAAQSNHPVVLLDLDSTLYEVAPRNHQILHEWAISKESALYPNARDALFNLDPDRIGYSVRDTFLNLNLRLDDQQNQEALRSASDFWFQKFFTSDYLRFDRPYKGAAEFVRRLHELSVEIVYLTGRDEPNMGDGTRSNLIRDQFPWGTANIHLLMKPSFHQPDLEHKLSTAEFVESRGNLIASFENEPPNLVALSQRFPEAMHIFVDTVCSDHPTAPCTGIYRIRGFCK